MLKFGQIIGTATDDIPAGVHVHTHNCSFSAHDQDYSAGTDLNAARAAVPDRDPLTFDGHRRTDGRLGTRNDIAFVATVNCPATVIRKASRDRGFGSV